MSRDASPLDVLRALTAVTRREALPPPAALIGDWWGADAVIAPSLDIRPGVAPPDVPDRFWLGYLGFPVRGDESALPPTAGGLTDGVLVLRDGAWSWISPVGTPCPAWVTSTLASPPPEPPSSPSSLVEPVRTTPTPTSEPVASSLVEPVRSAATNRVETSPGAQAAGFETRDSASASCRSGATESGRPHPPTTERISPSLVEPGRNAPTSRVETTRTPTTERISPSLVEPVRSAATSRVETSPGAESAHPGPPAAPWTASWSPPDPAPHARAIENCLEAIAAGEVYQACICTRFTGRLDGDVTDFFAGIAAATTPRKAALLRGDWGAVASFSPELFLRRDGRQVTSSPIKGTLPATADPALLAASVKDVAENVMIVDLVRNDLGRVADVGTVTVPELLTVVPAPGVWHLVSTVSAELDDAVGNDALLAATFPPASVTGTPKIRAMELIAEWERHPRGVYCGAIGIAGPGGLLDLNVAIRTAQIAPDGSATLGVGGGITYDSVPAAEWQECLDKARAIVSHG